MVFYRAIERFHRTETASDIVTQHPVRRRIIETIVLSGAMLGIGIGSENLSYLFQDPAFRVPLYGFGKVGEFSAIVYGYFSAVKRLHDVRRL
ncbi:MAG: hypothetical protein M3Q44_07555 [bacterium]|nr:hypothetical protein [bacterium]